MYIYRKKCIHEAAKEALGKRMFTKEGKQCSGMQR
jgi:hypothetical protein